MLYIICVKQRISVEISAKVPTTFLVDLTFIFLLRITGGFEFESFLRYGKPLIIVSRPSQLNQLEWTICSNMSFIYNFTQPFQQGVCYNYLFMHILSIKMYLIFTYFLKWKHEFPQMQNILQRIDIDICKRFELLNSERR